MTASYSGAETKQILGKNRNMYYASADVKKDEVERATMFWVGGQATLSTYLFCFGAEISFPDGGGFRFWLEKLVHACLLS